MRVLTSQGINKDDVVRTPEHIHKKGNREWPANEWPATEWQGKPLQAAWLTPLIYCAVCLCYSCITWCF
jgi:hypothetical protein